MLFTSLGFLVFLAVLIPLYFLVPKKIQWIVLLVANAFFYVYAGTRGLIFISVTIVTTYIATMVISHLYASQEKYLKDNKESLSKEAKKAYKNKMQQKRRLVMILCAVVSFGIIAVMKYSGLFLRGTEFAQSLSLILPLGISYYTFQTMGYLIDVYRGTYSPEKNIFKLALFTSFFPLLLQGPITRFGDIGKQLYEPHTFNMRNFTYGLERILWGYFKKVVIADRILIAVKAIISEPDEYNGVYVLCGMVFYAIQLYCDFTGGIDITIGIVQILGISLPENFLRPFFSKNIAEYWRRWHISLGVWFREYLFYPISVSKPLLKLSKFTRNKIGNGIGMRIPVYVATVTVWFITGLWHGSAWNFIVWGLLNAAIIIISEELSPLYAKFHGHFPGLKQKWLYRLFEIGRMFFIMCSLRVLDCYRNVGTAFKAYSTIFTRFNYNILTDGSLLKLGLGVLDYVVVFCGVALIITISLLQRTGSIRDKIAKKPIGIQMAIFAALLFIILIFGAYGIGYDSSQFIYTEF
ncbi:MAG: MBOAT family protein [Clostridia bacterium]|nr:MBOAT family protein [Clostridia bacterium]